MGRRMEGKAQRNGVAGAIVSHGAVLAWVVAGAVIATAAVLFPLLFVQDRNRWHSRWQGVCEERGHLLKNGFEQSFKLVDVLAQTLERFYIWPDPPQINQEGFKEYLRGIIPGTFISNCIVMRFITEAQRPAYETKRGRPLIHLITGKPPGPDRLHPILELVEDSNNEPILGLAMDHTYDEVYTLDDSIHAGETGVIIVSPPAAATAGSLSLRARQYIFVAAQAMYRERMAANATAKERLESYAAVFAVNFDVWSIVEGIASDLQDGEKLLVKLVDVTDKQKQPLPLYIPALETRSKRGNWTFADYRYKQSLVFGNTNRRYEIWCRPAPGIYFFPARAVGYSAGVLLVGLSIAQILWVYAKSITVSEARCREALQLKDEMALAKKVSDDHSAAKSAFVASVSHEIRTPMNGVLGMLGLLIDTTEMTPVQDDYARTALSSGRALLSLVNDILDLSKIESSCMDLENIPFSVTDEMDGILSMFGERSRGKNLELSLLVQPGVPPTLMGDPNRFRQIIINLIGNSLKFCNHGHIFVRIMAVPENKELLSECLERFHSGHLVGGISSPPPSGEKGERDGHRGQTVRRGYASHVPQSGEKGERDGHRGQTVSGQQVCDIDCCWPSIKAALEEDLALADKQCPTASNDISLLVWVEDSGIGIQDAAKDRIFKPFMQADKSTARMYGGTGIGLNISKKLVELMSGQLDFTSCVNKGTTFRFNVRLSTPLPSTSKRHNPTHNSSDPVPPASLALPQGTTINALCIDNNALRAEITCTYLRRMGITARASVLPLPHEFQLGDNEPHTHSVCAKANEQSAVSSAKPENTPLPDVIFLEAEPSSGEWGPEIPLTSGGKDQRESLSKGLKSTALLGKDRRLEQRLEWARHVAAPPGEGGEEGIGRDVPVVLLSNIQDVGVVAEAKKAGFAGVAVKPLRKAMLLACLQGALELGKTGRLMNLMEVKSQERESGLSKLESLVGRRVMVVDDNIVNRKVASKVLEKHKLVVTSMDSGESALKALMGDHEYCVVLTDIQMPGMDGYEMTRAIRSAEREGQSKGPWCALLRGGVPIFAMTADVMKGSLENCTEMGMDGMVPKPIEEARLLQVIEDSLQSHNG